MAQLPFPRTRPLPELRYVRAPEPIHFPEEAEVPEGKRHFALRTFLFRMLQFALGRAHSLGSDQFVYWNARDTQRKLSPDVFVKVDVPDTSFGSWKTWERGGAPELAVEIVSPANKDRLENRRVFAAKCAALLQRGVSVSIVDLVSNRRFNLYSELLDLLGQVDRSLPHIPSPMYATTC